MFEESGGVVAAVWGRRSGLEENWDVAKENEIVEDAGLSERVGEARESDVMEVRIDGGSFQRAGRHIALNLDEGDEKSIPVLRELCQITSSKEKCMMAAFRGRKACLPRAATME